MLRVCFFFGRGSTLGGRFRRSCTGGGVSSRLEGMTPPPSVLDATAEWVRQYAPKGGMPRKQTKRGPEVVVVQADAPPHHRGKGPTPSPKPSPKLSKVAKVAAQPPPEALDVEALGASVANLVTDRFQCSKRPPRGLRPHWPRVGPPTTSPPSRKPKRSRATPSVPWTRPSTWPPRGGSRWRR